MDQCAVIEGKPHDWKRCENEAADDTACAGHQPMRRRGTGQFGFNLIVRNEERCLERCLTSVRGIADEIVVCDTGSQDGTIDIALKHADKVLYHEWRDSFSEARNFSIQFSRTDWIGWIDADEWLYPDAAEQIQHFINFNQGSMAMFCALLSILPDGRRSKHYLPKFFRLGTAHFEHIVHNQLVHMGPITKTEIRIGHDGYALNEDTMKKKRERTIALLKQQLAENVDDGFATMNLARTYMTHDKPEESLELAYHGMTLNETTASIKQMLCYNIAMCQMNKQKHEKSIKACWDGLALNPENLDLTFILGWAHASQGDHAQGIVFLNRFLQLREAQETDGFNLLILDFWEALPMAQNFLGICYGQVGRKDLSVNAHRASVLGRQYDPALWKSYIVALQGIADLNGVKSALYAMVDRGIADKEVCTELAKVTQSGG